MKKSYKHIKTRLVQKYFLIYFKMAVFFKLDLAFHNLMICLW